MKPNIILITIDALRADHLGFMGYKKDISPNIDDLAEESNVFKRAFSVGPETSYSFPAILTSTYPLDYQGPRKIKKPRVLISEVLEKAGYVTAAFHSNPYLSNFFGYNKGWDVFEYVVSPLSFSGRHKITDLSLRKLSKFFKKISLSLFPQVLFWAMYAKYRIKKRQPSPKVRASFLNQIIKDFLNSLNQEKPFFIWVHYMDVHSPYLSWQSYHQKGKVLSYSEMIGDYVSSVYPVYRDKRAFKKFIKKYFEKYIKKTTSFYDQAIRYTDRGIGDLLNFLKKGNFYKNTIICLTADHGDEFLEHGGIGHTAKLYNELLHIPLLIKIPGGKSREINKKTSLIDLPSTILDLAEINQPSSFKGENLFTKDKGLIFHQAGRSQKEGDCNTEVGNISQCLLACQSDEWKYIIDNNTDKEELYNLLQDKKEENNLINDEPKILNLMRKKIREFEEKNPPLLTNNIDK